MTPLFKPHDFNEIMSNEGLAKEANILLNDWLAREGKVVYGDSYRDDWTEDKLEDSEYQAVVLNIKPIEKKCVEHEPQIYAENNPEISWCINCGKKLKATWTEIEGD